MGGAFVGLADDANATYWNPAGLAQVARPSATWMHTMTNRDEINYQDYLAFTTPAGVNGIIGISWIGFKMGIASDVADEQDWYWLSAATRVNPDTSFGMNIRSIDSSLGGFDTEIGFAVSFLTRLNDQWSLGLLVQNVNEPEMSIDDIPIAE